MRALLNSGVVVCQRCSRIRVANIFHCRRHDGKRAKCCSPQKKSRILSREMPKGLYSALHCPSPSTGRRCRRSSSIFSIAAHECRLDESGVILRNDKAPWLNTALSNRCSLHTTSRQRRHYTEILDRVSGGVVCVLGLKICRRTYCSIGMQILSKLRYHNVLCTSRYHDNQLADV